MKNFDLKKYEYKSPSYKLTDRNKDYLFEVENSKTRYSFDEKSKTYKSKENQKDTISLLFAGDLLCQENMMESHRTGKNSFDFTLCFDYLKPLLESCDFAVGNLETPIADTAPYRGEIITHEGPFYCNAPIDYLKALKYAGFDMLTTANNHTLDAGARGLYETVINTRKFDIIQTGTFIDKSDKFVIVDICGFKVGFTAFSVAYNSMQNNLTKEGRITLLNTYTRNRAETIYSSLKEKGAEYIVAFPHWGKEFTFEISQSQQDMAHDLVEIGYDCVVGSHAHYVQKFEYIHDKPVLFGLGNLMSHMNHGAKQMLTQYPLIYHLKLKRENGTIVPTIDFIPCRILKNYKNIPFTVVPCVNDLDYDESLKELLDNTPSKVKKMLEVNHDMINVNYRISDESKNTFKGIENKQFERVKKLLPVVEKKEITINNFISKKLVENKKDIVKNNICSAQVRNNAGSINYLLTNASVIRLPAEIDGIKIKEIDLKNKGNDTTRIVYISKKVTKICKGSFENFTQLESVRIFEELKVIESCAFKNCTKMMGIILPAGFETIESKVFENCVNLKSIQFMADVKYIDKNAFKGCKDLVLYGPEGSYIEMFAKESGFEFVANPNLNNANYNSKGEKKMSSLRAKLGKLKRKLKRKINKILNKKTKKVVKVKEEPKIQFDENNKPIVVYGPKNGENDKHPLTIQRACMLLGVKLPDDAICKYPPSKYIAEGAIETDLDFVLGKIQEYIPVYEREELETNLKSFERKFKSQQHIEFNLVDLTVYFTDWLLHGKSRGFTHNCYFDYELYNKEAKIRDTFLNEGYRRRISRVCNKKEDKTLFLDKGKFNETFKKYVKRDWLDGTSCTFDEFKEFLGKHDKFFGKPIRGTGGAGARVIESNSDTAENLFEIVRNEGLIVEEVIKQHPEIAEFNASTLNTVRINTLICPDGIVRILLTVARFGRSGNVVDNFHGGGVGAIVDIETGIIITEAINRGHLKDKVHPDSKKEILGFKYPEWEKVKKAVCEAALLVPTCRHIGWDVCVTENGEVEFVEGNSRPNVDVLQSPDQLGRRFRYEPFIPELERMEGITRKKLRPLVIDPVTLEIVKKKAK